MNIRSNAAQLTFSSVKDLPDYVSAYIATGKGVSFSAKDVRVKFTGRDATEELTKFLVDCGKK